MARSLSGTAQYFSSTTATATAVPLTLACWGYTTTFTTAQVMLQVSARTGGTVNLFDLLHRGDLAGDFINARSIAAGTSASAATGAAPSSGVWFHGCAVFAATNSRTAYINGGNSATNGTSSTPSGINSTTVGANRTNSDTFTGAWNGRLAHAAIWNLALSADDVGELAAGYSPRMVHPHNLIGYWPLYGRATNEEDWVGGNTLTKTGSPTAIEEPRIIYRPRRRVFLPAAVGGGGGFQAAWARNANSIIGTGAAR